MANRMIRQATRLICLVAFAAICPSTARGQAPLQPGPIPVARLSVSPAPNVGPGLLIRSGLQVPVQRSTATRQEAAAPDLKSDDTALWLSLGSTLLLGAAGATMIALDDSEGTLGTAGALIASTGIYFGPAVGYWYGGASGRGWKGVGIRFGTGLLTGLGVLAICGGNGGENCSVFDSGDEASVAAASILMLAGLGVITFSAIYDIANVKSHVRRANEVKSGDSARLSVVPVVSPANGGTAGLYARVSF